MANWTKQKGDRLVCLMPPFKMEVFPKGDGRHTWRVFADGNENELATGHATSASGAKNVAEQFVKRSGRI